MPRCLSLLLATGCYLAFAGAEEATQETPIVEQVVSADVNAASSSSPGDEAKEAGETLKDDKEETPATVVETETVAANEEEVAAMKKSSNSTTVEEEEANSTSVEASNATVEEEDDTKELSEESSIMSNLTVAFVGETLSPLTFLARPSGKMRDADTEGRRLPRMRPFRLGNLEFLSHNMEKGTRALRKKLPKTLLLLREAPVQPEVATSEEEMNGTANATVADVWSFDGHHVAQTLVESYPKLFAFSGTPYELDADVRRARRVSEGLTIGDGDNDEDSVSETTPQETAGANETSTSREGALESVEETAEEYVETEDDLANFHILSAAGKIRRAKGFEKLAEAMRASADDSPEAQMASQLLNAMGGGKKRKYQALLGIGMMTIIALGAVSNFGRGQRKWKTKPSKAFIEREQKSL
ncbi:unnamed protein product [Amoebophrya sp. A25]|nr:unnamed protein product [Amoebophrya sp. A25]|eukprot:GSA25T00002613001.1